MEKIYARLGTSFRFHEKLGLQLLSKCCCFSFMCHVYVLSLICLFIISGKFDALHQLSIKYDPLEIQHPKLKNSRRGCIESIVRDNGICDIPHAA